MKIQTIKPTRTVRDIHLAPYASALILYAEKNQAFAQILAHEAKKLLVNSTFSEISQVSSPFTITDKIEATTLASWVLTECTHDAPFTQALLKTFANKYESPKDFFVLGLGGTIAPGLTIGNPSIKKKHRGKLQVLIAKKYAEKLTSKELAGLVVTEGQGVLAGELKLAGGTITRLHPDSATWLMSDPETKVEMVEQDVLEDLSKIIESEKLSGKIKRQDSKIQLIVVSPAVPDCVAEDLL